MFVRVLRIKIIKSYLLRNQNSMVLALEPVAGQNTAMHASPNARDVFFEPFRSIHLHFFYHKLS